MPVRTALDVSGPLHFSWVIPGAAFALAVFLASLRLLAAVDPRVRRLMLTAGGIFVLGALGMEMLGGWWVSIHGRNPGHPDYILLFTLEETFEIAGMSLMLVALLVQRKLMARALTAAPENASKRPNPATKPA